MVNICVCVVSIFTLYWWSYGNLNLIRLKDKGKEKTFQLKFSFLYSALQLKAFFYLSMSTPRSTISNPNSSKTSTASTAIATSGISTTVHNKNSNDTVTLRNLTAYDMLDERINMLELFNLVDTSEIDKYKLCYDVERQQNLLQTLKNKIDVLK